MISLTRATSYQHMVNIESYSQCQSAAIVAVKAFTIFLAGDFLSGIDGLILLKLFIIFY